MRRKAWPCSEKFLQEQSVKSCSIFIVNNQSGWGKSSHTKCKINPEVLTSWKPGIMYNVDIEGRWVVWHSNLELIVASIDNYYRQVNTFSCLKPKRPERLLLIIFSILQLNAGIELTINASGGLVYFRQGRSM